MQNLSGSAEQPADPSVDSDAELPAVHPIRLLHQKRESSNAACNNETDNDPAHFNFHISDAADEVIDGEADNWDIEIQYASVAPEGEGMIWHRYQDPASKKTWLSCFTQPELWCYESEVLVEEWQGRCSFLFQGKWQEVVKSPPTDTTPAVVQPNTTDDSGAPARTRGGLSNNDCALSKVCTEDPSGAVQPASDGTEPGSASRAAQRR